MAEPPISVNELQGIDLVGLARLALFNFYAPVRRNIQRLVPFDGMSAQQLDCLPLQQEFTSD